MDQFRLEAEDFANLGPLQLEHVHSVFAIILHSRGLKSSGLNDRLSFGRLSQEPESISAASFAVQVLDNSATFVGLRHPDF